MRAYTPCLVLCLTATACSAAGSPSNPPAPGAAGAAWELYLERSSGGPPFGQNRLQITSAGDVRSVEDCQMPTGSCMLRIPNAAADGPTAKSCDDPKRPSLHARATAPALAALAKIVTSDAFAELKDKYIRPEYDVGSFHLTVKTARGIKTIDYSPWDEFEKAPTGKQLDEALMTLLASVEAVEAECVTKENAPAITPPTGR